MGIDNRELLKVHDIKQLFKGENLSYLQGMIFPRHTTASRNALTGSARFEGMVIFNTTTKKLNVFNGTAWEAVTSA